MPRYRVIKPVTGYEDGRGYEGSQFMQPDRLIKLGCLVEDAEAPDPEVAFGGEVPAPVVEQPQELVKEVTEKTDPKGKK